MKRKPHASLPPIEVEARPEKLTVLVSTELKESMEQFGRFFADASGQTPTSFNAIIVGILTGYLEGHGAYQKWLKSRPRSLAHVAEAGAAP